MTTTVDVIVDGRREMADVNFNGTEWQVVAYRAKGRSPVLFTCATHQEAIAWIARHVR
jgi:hypothetical protein